MTVYRDLLENESEGELLKRYIHVLRNKDDLSKEILESKAPYPGRNIGRQIIQMRKVLDMEISLIEMLKEKGYTEDEIRTIERWIELQDDVENFDPELEKETIH